MVNRGEPWIIDGSPHAVASTTWQPRKMLEPQGRLSIYDIVRPPTGFVLDCLIATTYTTSLDTVLSLPAAMLADIPGIGRRTAGVFTATELAQRNMELHCTIQDGQLLIGDGTNAVQIELMTLKEA